MLSPWIHNLSREFANTNTFGWVSMVTNSNLPAIKTMTMTLYDFVQLSQVEKASIVFEAQFLSCKEDDKETIVLYRVEDFFCEVVYDTVKNSVVKMKPFRSKDLVEQFFAYQLN